MVLDAPPVRPRSGDRSATVSLRSRFIDVRDSTVPVALYLGQPPILIDGCVIVDISWSWGASADRGVLTVADAGGGSIRLYDPERRFDPTNDESDAIDLTTIGTRVQVWVAGVPAFTGRLDDIDHDLEVASIKVTDDVAALAAVQFTETNVPAETASARVVRILDLAAWPASLRDVTAGGVTLQAGTVAADAWSELVEVTRNELGALWLKPDGTLAWRPRANAWAATAPAMVFGCPPSDVPLIALQTGADQSNLVNVLTASRRTGTARTVTDSPSLGRYGRHSHVQNDLEMSTDVARDAWQDFYLRRQATPARGVSGFNARPGAAAIAKALGLTFGAIVTVKDEGHGPTINRPARWVGTRWQIQPRLVELLAVTGEDASIRQVDRTVVIDTPAEWQAYLPNDVTNGSFESDLTGWTVGAAGITVIVSADAVDGQKVLQIVGGAPYAGVSGPYIPVMPYHTYRLRAYVKRTTPTGNGGTVSIHTYANASGGGASYHAASMAWLGTDVVGYKELYWACPASGVAFVQVNAFINNNPTSAAETWVFDDVSFRQVTNATFREPGVTPTVFPQPPSTGG